ncbi:MAG: rod shape-determining protein [Oscillospiraceae bacterium]
MLGMKIGIDFGSSSTIMYVDGKGIILDEPTAIAVDSETKRPIAIGNAAYTIDGRTDQAISIIKPIVGGVISNYTMAEHILKYYFQKICGNSILKPCVIASIPSGATSLDRRTLLDVLTSAGAARVCFLEESLASSMGLGLEDEIFSGRLLVNIGGGCTDVSVVTMGSIAVSKSIKLGGISIDEAIQKQLKKTRDILVGSQTAERLKICLGSAVKRKEELAMVVSGKSNLDNLPITFEVTSSEIFDCVQEQVALMINGIKNVLEKTPPELSSDLSDNGIVLTGGTAFLAGLDKLIEKETGIETTVSNDAVYCTVNGTAKAIKNLDLLSENGYTFQTIHDVN